MPAFLRFWPAPLLIIVGVATTYVLFQLGIEPPFRRLGIGLCALIMAMALIFLLTHTAPTVGLVAALPAALGYMLLDLAVWQARVPATDPLSVLLVGLMGLLLFVIAALLVIQPHKYLEPPLYEG